MKTQSNSRQPAGTLARFGSRRAALSRRGFLGGSGAAVALGLPALDALSERNAHAQAPGARRVVTLHTGSGMPMEMFTPDKTGTDYDLKQMLSPFAQVQSKLSVFSGLGIEEGKHSPGDHGAGCPVTYTCVTPKPTAKADYSLGVSFDQLAAKQFAQFTRIPSLQLGLSEGADGGDGPYGPIYLKHISWADATTPLPRTLEPAVVFDQIFAGYDPALTAAQNQERLGMRRSVLDYVTAERDFLVPALGAVDQRRVEQYFTSIREVETRLEQAQAQGPSCGGQVASAAAPATNLSYPERFRAMADLIVLALQCDVTRVVSLQGTCFRNDDVYGTFLDTTLNHHSSSHPGNDRDRAEYQKVCRWIMDQFAYLMVKLDEVQETGGTLLDNSVVVYNSDCGTAYSHDHEHLPVLVGGSAGGQVLTGRHFVYPKNTHCAGLYVTLLNAVGVPTQTFGEQNTGPLEIA